MTRSNCHHHLLLLFGLHALFLIFALLAGRCVGHAVVDCLPHDRSALLDLKSGFQNFDLVSWKKGSNCCDWEGVTCDPEYGHVVGLDLSSRYISGNLSASLFNLTSLQALNLADNWFDGSFPQMGFEELTELIHLNLSYSGLSGQIPIGISRLTRLFSLDLAGFQGIPTADELQLQNPNLQMLVQNLSNLRELHLDYVNMSSDLNWSRTLSTSMPRLQVLSLSYCDLTGLLPKDIFTFKNWMTLDFSGNSRLYGVLPDFPKNNVLKALRLYGTNLSGNLPSSIANLTQIVTLELSSNSLCGSIPLDLLCLPTLEVLDLSDNQFSGQLGEISNPTQIRVLDLSDNMIGGDIPNWIWSSGLEFLNLSNNLFKHLEGPINLPISDIQVLDLHSNMLQGSFPLPPLVSFYLDYSNNNFSSIIPFNISFYLASTSIFLFSNNNLSGEIPMSICEANNLLVIDFSYNSLSGPIPPCLLDGNTPSPLNIVPRSLNIRRNQLQGTIPHNITKGCPLVALDLNGNHLEGPLPRSLANCSLLKVLDLGSNRLVDSFPLWLGNITTLRVLILRENRFYGPIAPTESHCGNCTFSKLQVLDVSSNYFNGSLLSKCFGMLKVLRNFGLNYSTMGFTISGSYSTEARGFTFEVTENGYFIEASYSSIQTYSPIGFSRPIIGFSLPIMPFHYSVSEQYYQAPVTVTNKGAESTLKTLLSIFTSLDFSNNAFEGEIPDVIGELQGLLALNLSHNSLTGKIPAAIGKIKQLESLDLSGNHLSGEIPQEMTSLTFLSWLNLSDNNLVGRIPQSNQFSTFPNASFEGNKGLCGEPLSKQCSDARPNKTVAAPLSKPDTTYVIGLGLFVGLGFGVGMAAVLVLQNVSWKFLKRQDAANN